MKKRVYSNKDENKNVLFVVVVPFYDFCLLLCCLHLNNEMPVMYSDVKKLLLIKCFFFVLNISMAFNQSFMVWRV